MLLKLTYLFIVKVSFVEPIGILGPQTYLNKTLPKLASVQNKGPLKVRSVPTGSRGLFSAGDHTAISQIYTTIIYKISYTRKFVAKFERAWFI